MLNKFYKLLSLFHESYIWLISNRTKKNNKIWVFGAIRGQKYMDNAKYLFEYINQSTDIDAIWISKNKALIKKLKDKGFNAFYAYSPEALYYAKKS